MQTIAVIGLAVMGENLALNLERNGFSVAVYNRSRERTLDFMAGRGNGKRFAAALSMQELAASLERPRRVLLMVKAGAAVDAVIEELRPHLDPGDIVIDGGNSHYPDTERRSKELDRYGLKFFGMGVSGGEEGALWGPSLMPGGDRQTYALLEPVLTRIAAVTDSGPCVTYIGSRGSGHFVKMVHNGIEYGDMQLIAEAYDLMLHDLGLSAGRIADTFAEWNRGELQSFLVEITSRIADFPDDLGTGRPLVAMILDRAAQKGTGKWTTAAALDLGVPIPTITAAVDARVLSSFKELRRQGARAYPPAPSPSRTDRDEALKQLRAALYASKICSYAQGFDLLRRASVQFDYGVDLSEVARIWKGGCIIRAVFLDRIREAFARDPDLPNLLLDRDFAGQIRRQVGDWRRTIIRGVRRGIALPAMTASLAYFDAFRRENLPANLIQAQRDLFGAHTYERIDREGNFHTRWEPAGKGRR